MMDSNVKTSNVNLAD